MGSISRGLAQHQSCCNRLPGWLLASDLRCTRARRPRLRSQAGTFSPSNPPESMKSGSHPPGVGSSSSWLLRRAPQRLRRGETPLAGFRFGGGCRTTSWNRSHALQEMRGGVPERWWLFGGVSGTWAPDGFPPCAPGLACVRVCASFQLEGTKCAGSERSSRGFVCASHPSPRATNG